MRKMLDPAARMIAVCAIGAIALTIGHTGCSSFDGPVQLATVERDAEAKSFLAVPGKARIYIYREQGYIGNEEITVDVGSWAGGRTTGKTFLLATVDPGAYVLAARGDEREELPIQVEGGEIYFIKLRVRPAPVTANASLQLVDTETGKTGVRRCRLVKLDDAPELDDTP
ncbi:MAG: hypothetical protein WBD30_07475 [Bacteroidota bacterium]